MADKPVNEPKCAACGIVSKRLLDCAQCRKTNYCSKACQHGDWKNHKKSCKAPNYILRIELDPANITNPSIFRVLSCPASATFEQLHIAIQIAFGWTDLQTYDFKFKDPTIGHHFGIDDVSNISRALQLPTTEGELFSRGPKQNLLRIVKRAPAAYVAGRGGMAVLYRRAQNAIRAHKETPEIFSDSVKLGRTFENKEYRYAKISYEYDFNDRWVHNIDIIGRTKATDKFECTDGAGHGVAEKIGGWGPWKELKDNYRTLVPSEKQKEQRVWFENIAMNADPEGLFNGHENFWDKEAVNSILADYNLTVGGFL